MSGYCENVQPPSDVILPEEVEKDSVVDSYPSRVRNELTVNGLRCYLNSVQGAKDSIGYPPPARVLKWPAIDGFVCLKRGENPFLWILSLCGLCKPRNVLGCSVPVKVGLPVVVLLLSGPKVEKTSLLHPSLPGS